MKKLQNNFKTLLKSEKNARRMYTEILRGIEDKEVAGKVDFIRKQEIGHVRMAEILVGIAQKAEKRRGRPRISENTLTQLRGDIALKKFLLNALIQLLATKLQTFTLLTVLGKENKKFKKAEESRQDLIKTITHQMKTPLTVTKLVSESLLGKEGEKLTKDQKEMVGQVETVNKSMFSLVDELLEISRIEEGKEKLVSEKVNLVKLIKEIINELAYLVKNKKQKVLLQTFKKDIVFLSDKKALNKIISNLLTNAINYGKDKGKTTIKLQKEKKNSILISVLDDGIGIPKKEQKDIFNKFYRATNAQQFHSGGTGLGLYMTKRLVEKMNGKIWFESKEGKGTTFFVSLALKT